MYKLSTRYQKPTNKETAPYISICRVVNDKEEPSYYIQVSKDEKHPNWMLLKDFLGIALNQKLAEEETFDEKFEISLEECIKLFEKIN